jgi:sortase A
MSLRVGVAAMLLALSFVGVVALVASFSEPMEPAAAAKSAEKPAVAPLTRSDPGVDPWVEEDIPAPQPEPEAQPKPVEEQAAAPQPKPESEPRAKPEPESPESRPEPKPEPEPEPESESLPVGESAWSEPTAGELEAASEPRHYDLPAGAIMGLTVPDMGIYNAPVFDSVGRWALTNGVAHHPETSLPWSRTPERNVYLGGHRMGYSGTWSRMIFYHLDKLGRGDEVLLKDRNGGKYEYRVIESFVVDPDDSWVMGRVRGRDMLTLQTCTGPNFSERLIVRAERV